MKLVGRRCLIGMLLVVLSHDHACGAEPGGSQARIEALTVGLGGQVKVGYWIPVRLRVTAGAAGFEGQLVLEAADGDGAAARYEGAEAELLALPAGQSWTGWRYIKLGRQRRAIRALLRQAGGQAVQSQTIPLPEVAPSRVPWIVAAGAPDDLDEAARLVMRRRQQPLLVTRLTERAQFPDRWYGYEGVRVLLLCTGRSDPISELSAEQFAALMRWLELGGRMVLSAGRRAETLFAEGARLAPLRPGTWEDSNPHWRASGLEQFAGTTSRLLNPDQVAIPLWTAPRGRVLCSEGGGIGADRPLVMRFPWGFGQVTYVAFDLDLPPVADWPGQGRLLARLLEDRRGDEDTPSDTGSLGRVRNVGFEDLAGQLHGALDQFGGVRLFHFSWVAGLLVLYLVWIGPVDYFLLRRWRRPHWTWVTFPLIVVGFAGLSVFFSHHWKGTELNVNQADVLDVDLERGLVRGTTWANIYSPRAAALDLRLEPAGDLVSSPAPQVLLSWQGLPGTGLGGMGTTATVGRLTDAYSIVPPEGGRGTIHGFPVHTSSSKQLVGRWWSQAEGLPSSTLTADEGGFLHGEVVNPLSVELERCAVYYRNWMYRLERRLPPGAATPVDAAPPLDLKWHLTRRRLMSAKDQSAPWDRTDFGDVPRILDMLMFHEAAGGYRYTQLAHRYQAFVDLSEHLRNGRAILVGQVARPVSRLQPEDRTVGAQQQWSNCRIVIPVERSLAR